MMNFYVDNSVLSTVISELHKVCTSRSVIPILSGIKIVASKNGLTLIGGNSELFIEKTIPLEINGEQIVEVIEEGSVVVLSKIFSEILKKLPGKVQIQADMKESVVIKSDEVVTKIPGFNADEYPKLPDVHSQKPVELTLGTLKEAINQTIFAVSKNDTKPVLTGLRMEFEKGKFICIATDSNRMSRCEVQISSELIEAFVVPAASMLEILQVKDSDSTSITVLHESNLLVMEIGNTKLISVLIEGNYPNTQGLIPTEFISSLTLNRKALLAGVDRACVFSRELKHNNVLLRLGDRTSITISSSSTEMGMIEERQEVMKVDGLDSFDITLDGKYLIEALKGIKEENIEIQFNGTMKPIVIKPAQSKTYVQLISPRRTH
ncbi:DNA polymerase III subunit beta [Sporosarcina sp. Sa2YVA2]|uniref:Beta sliding clamp n=1 Tax=Sporosarcina quadrami TaxID=2762234 RepID=A0ABR8UDV5_9BACL|nr:DNA polymerase III subunit beta [Sporosarcina quadrami]MBD7986010.1 DNA polymerase III subunit beta [Sporosarcina quadrami]